MSAATTGRPWAPLLAAVLLALAAAAVFRPVLDAGFVNHDDGLHVFENRLLADTSPAGLAMFWKQPYMRLYIPASYTLWMLQARLSKVPGGPDIGAAAYDPAVFHRTNLAVHIASVLLVFLILRRLVPGVLPAFLGGLLFAVHPLQAESVAWISEFKGLLAGLFTLAAALLCLEHGRAASAGARRTLYVLALLAFVLGFLSKPIAVVALAFLPILAMAGGRNRKEVLLDILPWFVLAIPLIVLAKQAQPDAGLVYVTPVAQRPLIALDALAFYLAKLAWPVNLGLDYGRTPAVVMARGWSHLAWLAPPALGLLLWLSRRRTDWLAAPLALVVAGLLPVLGLVPFEFQFLSTVADRYAYLPMLGAALGLALAAARADRLPGLRRTACLAGLGLGLVALAGLATIQARTWNDNASLFTQALRVNPDSFVAHTNLGQVLRGAGRHEEAIAHFKDAWRLWPGYYLAPFNIGNTLLDLDRKEEALAYYREAVRIWPAFPDGHHNAGVVLERLGRNAEALEEYRRSLPGSSMPDLALFALGVVSAKLGQPEAAVEYYRNALRLRPGYADAHLNLADVLMQLGRRDEAVAHLRAAAELRPGDEVIKADLARALADGQQEAPRAPAP
jgi:tetratricopeptide (TPR) repeat protein/type IV secretory pathway VirB2 component (pilin)